MMPAITIQITATDIIINLKLSFFISSFKSYEFTIFISILRSDYHGSKIRIVVDVYKRQVLYDLIQFVNSIMIRIVIIVLLSLIHI